ncbi:NAD(P)/FAD-dependent oxidoreductase [Paracoccus sp. 1_MG-2023]|uniref:NAD(P)/FAD-dependent oxidoreductase n=1 Tax=unclassified Paracoccus (in: a-proteobacteria) TaxID=2688777 RepID=UPI001C094D15|nr:MULTISPECIES: NAD(P)/FAD-dependent oxidoreductase [unclassified Paracoccus (in: a-proteobacteria)]MBU2957655.1 NAD(P)/FAD-dependent oxidoreductase [Paracoccus sp. C2R09]MDO6667497.1 NAD(P)/FAD-dependent oxidoreductase [Paracoccus sp. 1_MG-2023]
MTEIDRRPRIVIIGAGFGGLAAAKALKNAPVDVEIIDKRNYHLFQPLLYQVATADLSPADIAWPIRSIFSKQKNVTVTLSKVLDIDTERQVVLHENGESTYDHLIIANGSSHSYFGKDHWAANAPGLKRIVDATEVRRRVLMAFERAELCEDPEDQARELTFVIVGAGPTGVELAGSIAELAHVTLSEDFRRIDPDDARIILMEGGPRILSAFPEVLSAKAEESLRKLGVEVRTGVMVEQIEDDHVVAGGETIPASTAIWAAGVKIENLKQWLGCETDRIGRVPVQPDLRVPGLPSVSVIGDAAKVAWKDGMDVPGVAPAAKQEGKYVGRRIAAEARGEKAPAPFRYRHMGSLATIGRNSAIISFGKINLSGFVAWLFWGLIHIYFLIGVKRPIFVAMSWFSNYVFRSKGSRLITGMEALRAVRAHVPKRR